MKLQQIKISGFKSFVENTLIDIRGQLVGIVGPNGCGKSNVIDAVRWVLGESSAKQLRGEAMTDVIFNGSLKRKPVSRATVELVFENNRKALASLWNSYDEIAIKRVISRQGESSYFINNQQVRRKDITELFLGTGVGAKGYAVIEQGMISRIIESKPEEMRFFIEEAAGVSKYRERRKETLQRLNATQENLQRLTDIQGEMLKQLEQLAQQAAVAHEHQRLSCELKNVQTLVLAQKVRAASTNLEAATQFIGHCEDELRVLSYQLEEINLSLVQEQESKSSHEQTLQQLLEQFNLQRTQLARVEERFKYFSDLLQRFETETTALSLKQQQLQHEIVELETSKFSLNEQIEAKHEQLSELTVVREQQQQEVAQREDAYQQVAAQTSARTQALSQLKHDLELQQHSLRHHQQTLATLYQRRERLVENPPQLSIDADNLVIQEELAIIEDEELTGSESLTAADVAVAAAREQLIQLQEQRVSLAQEVAASAARVTTLTALLQQLSDDESSSWLPLKDEVSRVWQHLSVSPGFETAVASAIGHLFKAKVIPDLSLVKDIPAHCASLWLQHSGVFPERKNGSLSQVVEIDNPALSGVYSHLNNYLVLEDWRLQAELAVGQLAVTREGHVCSRDFIIYHAASANNNLVQQHEQLKQEQSNLEKLEQQLAALTAKLAVAQQLWQQQQDQCLSLTTKLKALTAKRHQLQLELTKQQQLTLQAQQHQQRLEHESEVLSQEIDAIQDIITPLELNISAQQLSLEQLLNDGQELELSKLECETALQLSKNKLYELTERNNQLIMDMQLLGQQLQSSQKIFEDKKLQLAAVQQKLSDLNRERDESTHHDQAQQIMQIQEQIGAVSQQINQQQQIIDNLASKIISLKNKAAALNSSYQRNLEKINQTKFKQQEQQILLVSYQEQAQSLKLNLTEVKAPDASLNLDELSAQSNQLEQQITSLGLVNLKAIEDLAQVQDAEQELLLQLTDLNTASETLTAAIAQIDNETRKLLQATFDNLNAAVAVYFRTLFGGGSARLKLTDSDILVAGVQIFAEPPGKKNSSIHLLSGGEKALAAMSFIFALFSLNPAPFCLLDEVDAPLDDANTQRFCNLVTELAGKTQFVYISHNRLAMEMADQLVGVTMQEKGVSSVVSVNLVEAVAAAAQEVAH